LSVEFATVEEKVKKIREKSCGKFKNFLKV
jgi:hypothetical protein